MMESSLEELVQEQHFQGILEGQAEGFFWLANTLQRAKQDLWNKRHYFQLISEADALESFLDDFGARYNNTYCFLTELVASIRGFALAGYSVTHLVGRLDSYGAEGWLAPDVYRQAQEAVLFAKAKVSGYVVTMLEAMAAEASRLGIAITPLALPETSFLPVAARRKLPRNLGQLALHDEEQKIAEVVTKYLQACEMLTELGITPLEEPEERRRFLARVCTEEQARVYEATVHNLQSTYDTHIQNTVLEARDERLPRLRGHVSAALHLLEAITHLTHFVERHEDQIRSEDAKRRISELIDREEVQDMVLNQLLVFADCFLQSGVRDAEDLLPEYTNVQELEVELQGNVTLHARPASLVVSIVQHYGTPVEMVVGSKRCNAGSILELLVGVGSHPGVRRFTFRGDIHPLRDIRLLFEHGLGERGLERLPEELDYLRHGAGEVAR